MTPLLFYGCMTVFSILLGLSISYNIKFAKVILSIQSNIEQSLDTLDEKYNTISKILEKPVFFDSVEVRQVLTEMTSARDSILYVANILGDVESFDIQDDDSMDVEQ
jgi:hypothetical protein